jgi:hypothetical protein
MTKRASGGQSAPGVIASLLQQSSAEVLPELEVYICMVKLWAEWSVMVFAAVGQCAGKPPLSSLTGSVPVHVRQENQVFRRCVCHSERPLCEVSLHVSTASC